MSAPPYWSNQPPNAGPGGESPAALDANLRALREERGRLAAGVGEQVYRMVMSGQVRDPAIIAVCRPLYEIEQQMFRVESALRTYGSHGSQPAPDALPPISGPGARQPWESGPTAPAQAAPVAAPYGSASRQFTRQCARCRTPLRASDAVCPVCGHGTADAQPLIP